MIGKIKFLFNNAKLRWVELCLKGIKIDNKFKFVILLIGIKYDKNFILRNKPFLIIIMLLLLISKK